ncbi:MAG: FG-GAP-like repeat-containing protein, partial [Chloroflexales bacterium]
IVGNANASSQLYRNQGGTLVLDTTWTPDAQFTMSLAWGDVDGDGDLDLAVGNYGQPNQLYRNQGGTLVFDPTWTSDAWLTYRVAWGDVDNDGDLDLAVGNNGQPNQLYRNQNGTLVLDTAWTPDAQPTMSLAWGDVDGDGDLDLAVGNYEASNQLYLNQDGALVLDSRWHPEPSITMNIVWGDVDGDGDLDLTVVGVESKVYRNEGGTLVLDSWELPDVDVLAWGDVDNDGDLDLAAGWTTRPSQLYRNGTSGAQRLPANPPTVATRRPDSAAASAGLYSTARILDSRQISIPFTLTDPEGDPVRVVRAEYSLDGGGRWRPALPANSADTINLATLPERFPAALATPLDIPDSGAITSTVTVAAPANGAAGTITDVAVELTLTHPYIGDLTARLTAPDGTSVDLFSGVGGSSANMIGLILDDAATTPIAAGTAPFSGRFRPTGSLATLDGKNPLGPWTLSVADGAATNTGGLVAWALRIKTTGVQHIFMWDTFTSGVFGQSDNMVVRLIAYPSQTAGRNGVPLFQRPYAAATTFPFRVRGTQVRVVDPQNIPQPDAMVFRLNDALPREQQLFAASSTAPAYTTNSLGYLEGRGTLAISDTLIALAPVPLPAAYAEVYSPTVRLYATNIITTPTGVSGLTVAQSGVQTVTVSLAHPLALFDLRVSLEWDARYDARFMAQLQSDLARTSELLFQASHGQAALGSIAIFYDKENWEYADIRVYASNRVRPSAQIGGIASLTVTDPASNQVVYGPGQVRMGAVWNRFGSSNGSLSEDWPRTLVHELSHYLFFLEDNYLGIQDGQIVPVSSCPGLMGDLYTSVWQYQTRAGWIPGCDLTFSNQTTVRADWETITTFYTALRPPGLAVNASDLPSGPIRLPLATTEITSVIPLTPTARLAVPIFYTVDDAGGRVLPTFTARAYLFQHSHATPDDHYTQIVPLGRANNDQVLARGARVGDRLCLFEPTAARFGCETIRDGDEQLNLHHRPDWQPDIQVTPVTSRTLDVAVTGVPPSTQNLIATLYPLDDEPQPDPISLRYDGSSTYRGTFMLMNPLQGAYIHLATTDLASDGAPVWETVTNFALEGNAGAFRSGGSGGAFRSGGSGGSFARSGGAFRSGGSGGAFRSGGSGGTFARVGGAPVSSAEGDVLLEGGNLRFELGQFLLLQTTSSLPTPPAWATLIGQGYRFTTSLSTPDLMGTALSFSYLDSEVPTGEEAGIEVYYRSPTATAWISITTTLDTYFNLASIPTQGPGLYALMSSVHVALPAAGWNMFAYPVPISREVGLALGSISERYRIVYSHVPTDTLDPWKVYAPAPAPTWVSDLTELNFGHGYWIYATEATDLRLKGGSDSGTASALSLPPAVIYAVLANVPTGQAVEARIGGVICGRSVTRDVGGQVGLVVKVAAAGPDTPACGATGSTVTVTAAGREVGFAWWDNRMAVELAGPARIYLPMILR